MSGEIPTEASALAQTKRAVLFAGAVLTGNVSFEPDDETIAVSLLDVYAAIHSLFVLRGRTAELEAAVREADETTAEEARLRAELLEKYGIGSDTEAAELIASYWQGERPPDLLRCIRGSYTTEEGIETHHQAFGFAQAGTGEDPEARQMADNAQSLLWRNYKH